MSVFVAYSDEASIGDAKGEFLVGGYASSEDEWKWINRAWQERVLDGPPKLPYLHMIELRDPDWRKQVGISFNDSEERVAEGVRVMYSSGYTSAIAAVIKVSDFKEVFQEFKKGRRTTLGLDEPDYICYLAYASLMTAEVYSRYPEATRVNFVVSKKEKVTHHIEKEFHEDLRQFLQPPLVDLVGDLIPGDMELHIPLQAADMLCWHFQRYYGTKMNRSQEGRLAMLTLDTNGKLHVWGRRQLEEIAEGFPSRLAKRQELAERS